VFIVLNLVCMRVVFRVVCFVFVLCVCCVGAVFVCVVFCVVCFV